MPPQKMPQKKKNKKLVVPVFGQLRFKDSLCAKIITAISFKVIICNRENPALTYMTLKEQKP